MNYDEYMRIVQENIQYFLDKGENPWQMPWSGNVVRNGFTGRPYHGMNAVFLNMVADRFFEGEQRFYTWKQIQDLGLQVKKGAKAFPAYYFQSQSYRAKVDEDGNPVLDESGEQVLEIVKTKPFFMTFALFNAKQLDPVPERNSTPQITEPFDEEEAARILSLSPVPIHHDQSMQAFYLPSTDDIHLPSKNRFNVEAEYYSTVFHEMTHSTGAPHRLNRKSLANYALERPYEELIAEIGAVLLCDRVKLHYSNRNSAAYIQHWQRYIHDPDFNLGKLYKEVNAAFSYLSNPERRNDMALIAQKDGKNQPSEIATMQDVISPEKKVSAHPNMKTLLAGFDHAAFETEILPLLNEKEPLKKEPVVVFSKLKESTAREFSDLLGFDVTKSKTFLPGQELYLPLSVANELLKLSHHQHITEPLGKIYEENSFAVRIFYTLNNKTSHHDAGVFSPIDSSLPSGITYRVWRESHKHPESKKYLDYVKNTVVSVMDKHIMLSNLEHKAEPQARQATGEIKEYSEYLLKYCKQMREDLVSKPLRACTLQFLHSKEDFAAAKRIVAEDPPVHVSPKEGEAFAIVTSHASKPEDNRKMSIYDFDKFLARVNAYAKIFPGNSLEMEYEYTIPSYNGESITGTGRFLPGYAFKEHLSDFAKTQDAKASLENYSQLGRLEESVKHLPADSDPNYVKYANEYVENIKKLLVSKPSNAKLPVLLSQENWKLAEDLSAKLDKETEKHKEKRSFVRNLMRNR